MVIDVLPSAQWCSPCYSRCGLGIIHTLDLDQAGVRVGVALSPLVAEMATPVRVGWLVL